MNWRTIPGLPMYEASDTGLIRSKSRSVNVRHGDRQYRKVIPGKVLKLTPTVWRGRPHYMSVPIQEKTHLVHRLVALAWLGSTWFEGAEVNHRDGNKRNNCVTNLEWVTHQQNELHSYRVLGKGRQRPLTRREAPPPPETRRHESAQRENAVARVSEREARCRTRIRDTPTLGTGLAYDDICSSRRFSVTFDEMTDESVVSMMLSDGHSGPDRGGMRSE